MIQKFYYSALSIMTFSMLFIGSTYAANPVMGPLTDDQLKLVQQYAPHFIAPHYDPKVDRPVALNFDNNWLGHDNGKNAAASAAAESFVYFDYFEVAKFIVISYTPYRPWNAVPGFSFGVGNHPHDTENAVLIFEKRNRGSSKTARLADLRPELVMVLSNSHGAFISLATKPEYEAKLSLNMANHSRALLDSVMKQITGGVKVNGGEVDRVLKYDASEKTLHFYTSAKNHAMVPVRELTVAKQLLNNKTTAVFRFEGNVKPLELDQSTSISYKLLHLGATVNDTEVLKSNLAEENGKTKSECLLVPNTPPDARPCEDFDGNPLVVDPKLCRDLQCKADRSGDSPMPFQNQIIIFEKGKALGGWNELKNHRIPLVDIRRFLQEGFNGLVERADDLRVVHNDYYRPKF